MIEFDLGMTRPLSYHTPSTDEQTGEKLKGKINGYTKIYIDEILNVEGEEILFYKEFKGNFVNGLLEGESEIEYSSKTNKTLDMTYSGIFENGLANGKIIFKDNRKTLIGYWNNGNFDTTKKVVCKYYDGTSYIGFFKNNHPYGEGIFRTEAYRRVEGIFCGWSVYG